MAQRKSVAAPAQAPVPEVAVLPASIPSPRALFCLPEDVPNIMSAKYVAEKCLDVTARTVQRLATAGKLVGFYVGSDMKFTKAAVQCYMLSNPIAPATLPVYVPSRAGRKKKAA